MQGSTAFRLHLATVHPCVSLFSLCDLQQKHGHPGARTMPILTCIMRLLALAFPEKQTTGHPCLWLGSRLRLLAVCTPPLKRPSLCSGGESLASTHRGEYSLFVVPTTPKLTGSDESAMNFAAHITIFKGLLTRFQQLWPYSRLPRLGQPVEKPLYSRSEHPSRTQKPRHCSVLALMSKCFDAVLDYRLVL